MDRYVDGWAGVKNRQADDLAVALAACGWANNRWAVMWIDGWTGRQVDGQIGEFVGGRTNRCLDGQAVEGQANVESCIREYIRVACRWKMGDRKNPGRNRR